MLSRLRQLFQTDRLQDAESNDLLQLAAAALLIEVMRADHTQDTREAQAIRDALSAQFRLDDTAVESLLARAHEAVAAATDDYHFTARVNTLCDANEKAQIVEHMWRIAYADGHVDAYESHYLRKITELLHVPHNTYIAAKQRARQVWQA